MRLLSFGLSFSFQPLRFLTVISLVTIACPTASADFITPDFRGDSDSTYQQWDVFTSALFGPNLPDIANNNPNGTAQLVQTIPGAFVTGGGNIYAPSTPVSFTVDVPDYDQGAGFFTTAVLQIRTLGTSLDLTSVTFNGVAPQVTGLLLQQPLGGFGGFLEDWLFQWNNLIGNGAINTVAFGSAGTSMSLDRVAIDTIVRPVPEPSSIVLLLASTSVCGLIRRRW